MTETAVKNYTDLAPSQLSAAEILVRQYATLLIGKAGAGKTATALTAASYMLDEGSVSRILVLGTKKICETVWQEEAQEWNHLKHLRIVKALGTSTQKRLVGIKDKQAQIVLLNYENVAWLSRLTDDHFDFDGIIFDEITKCSPSSYVFKSLRRKLKKMKWRVGMTASPVSENYLKLFSMIHLLDDGKTFGSNNQTFKETYFIPTDYERRSWILRPCAAEQIANKVWHLTHVMPDYRYKLPDLEIVKLSVDWGPYTQGTYRRFIKDMVISDHAGSYIQAANSAVLQQRLHQLTQGFLYDPDDPDQVVVYNQSKIPTLKAISAKHADENMIVVYWFQEDLNSIEWALPKVVLFTPNKTEQIVRDSNAGQIHRLAIHPRSAGHGLNLARGGRIMVFYTLYWSLELYEQTIARLWRTGQKQKVIIYLIVCQDGLDPIIINVLEEKSQFDPMFHKHLTQKQ